VRRNSQISLKHAIQRRIGIAPTLGLVRLLARDVKMAASFRGGFERLAARTNTVSFGHTFSSRYETWPIEFLPFLHTGGDGCAFGHVILTPELEPPDFPFAHLCPGDFGGIAPIARNTRDGVARVIAGTAKLHARRHGFRHLIALPRTWRYELTRDGVGIAAHRDQFGKWSPSAERIVGEEFDIDGWLATGDEHFHARRFATALWYYKEAWGWQWRPDVPGLIFSRLVKCYRALGKNQLATICARSFPWLRKSRRR
jgi:hypothetical protein